MANVGAVGLRPEFEQKRFSIHGRFASVIQRHLGRAVVEGSIPAQDTGLVSQSWIGALNEIISQWLISGGPPAKRRPELRSPLLRSIGAKS